MPDCFGCEYYGGVQIPATAKRRVAGVEVDVCDECAKWYDYFDAESRVNRTETASEGQVP